MSEENSKEAVVKKTTAKKPKTRSKTAASKATAAKPTAKKTAAKPAAKKAAPKKTSATTKATAAKATKPRTKAASIKTVEDEAPQQSTSTAENNTSSEDSKFETKNNGQTDTKPDTAQIIDDLKGRDWPQIIKRALLMFFFGVLGSFALYLSFVLAVAQVGFSIFLGQPNEALTRVMRQCAFYIRDVLDYLSFGSDECPFPFGRDLPDAD